MARDFPLGTIYNPELNSWVVIAIGTGNTVDNPETRPRGPWAAAAEMRIAQDRFNMTRTHLRSAAAHRSSSSVVV